MDLMGAVWAAVVFGHLQRPSAVSSRRHSVPPNVTPIFPEQSAMSLNRTDGTNCRSDPTPGRGT